MSSEKKFIRVGYECDDSCCKNYRIRLTYKYFASSKAKGIEKCIRSNYVYGSKEEAIANTSSFKVLNEFPLTKNDSNNDNDKTNCDDNDYISDQEHNMDIDYDNDEQSINSIDETGNQAMNSDDDPINNNNGDRLPKINKLIFKKKSYKKKFVKGL